MIPKTSGERENKPSLLAEVLEVVYIFMGGVSLRQKAPAPS